VHISLGAYSNDRAGISSIVRILPRREYEIVNMISTFFYFHLPIEMMVIAGLISVVLAIFFLWNRKERLYLYSLFAVLLYILFLVSLFYPFTVFNAALTRAINWSSYYLFAIALILIIQSLFGIYVPLYNIVCIPIFLIFTAAVYIFRNSSADFYIANTLAVMTELILVPVTAVMITRFHRARRDRFKMIAAALISGAGICIACLEIAFSLSGGAYSLFVTAYCAPFFLLVFVIIFAREQMKKNLELELLYRRLKVTDRGDEDLPLNEASKEKLDRVVEFIRENYTSDLSREGLAAAVGMNPNYMSGLFRQYTGRKVNEFINHLRIEDAIKKLEDREVKVIDVALSVGFESLSTFNRAFKKETGRTPTEFRESVPA
jgi:AraC-like DNA-binding protein